jgi:hypothetical protein
MSMWSIYKKPWRYRWPDDFRHEVFARLLELDGQRAEQERLRGAAGAQTKAKASKRITRRSPEQASDQPEMS